MTSQTRATLKGVFETGDTPTGTNYTDVMDSFLSLIDTTAQTVTSDLSVPKLLATTEVSAEAIFVSSSSRFRAAVSFGGGITVSASSHFGENITVSGSSRFIGALSIGGAVAVSGAATIAGTITVSGSSTFVLPVNVSATAVFYGYVAMGPSAAGRVTISQYATVSQINSAGNAVTFTVPPRADLIEIYVDTVVPWAAGSLSTAAQIEVGVSGSVQYFARIPVSATGTRTLGSTFVTGTLKRWKNFSGNSGDATGNIRAFVSAQSLGTAMTAGETLLTVTYVINP